MVLPGENLLSALAVGGLHVVRTPGRVSSSFCKTSGSVLGPQLPGSLLVLGLLPKILPANTINRCLGTTLQDEFCRGQTSAHSTVALLTTDNHCRLPSPHSQCGLCFFTLQSTLLDTSEFVTTDLKCLGKHTIAAGTHSLLLLLWFSVELLKPVDLKSLFCFCLFTEVI